MSFSGECYSGHGPTSAGFGVEWRHFQPQMALRTIPPGEMVVSQARPTYPSVHMQPSFCSQVSVNFTSFVAVDLPVLCKYIMIAAKVTS